MIKILQFLLHGCWHEWEPTGDVTKVVWETPDQFLHYEHHVRCAKCGRHSHFKSGTRRDRSASIRDERQGSR